MRKFLLIAFTILFAATATATSLRYRAAANRANVILSAMDSFDSRYYSYFRKNAVVRDLHFTLEKNQPVNIRVFTTNLSGSAAFYLEGDGYSKLLGDGREIDKTQRIELEAGEYSVMIDFRNTRVGSTVSGVDTAMQ